MKKLAQAFTSLVTIFGLCIFSFYASGDDEISFITKLKSKHQQTIDIKAFSLTHRYLGRRNAYQSWDVESATRYSAYKVTELDLENQLYWQNVVHHFTGQQMFDEVHFQNETASFRYERNGMSLGKRIIEQPLTSFNRYKNVTLINIDFLAILPILKETDVDKITLSKNKTTNTTVITHKASDKKHMEYHFDTSTLRLSKIFDITRQRVYIYDDYQTSNGLTYARSIIKYYEDLPDSGFSNNNSDSLSSNAAPSFITRLEDLKLLDGIENTKLQVPQEYGPVIESSSPISSNTQSLFWQQIAPELYLVSDKSNVRNTLVKVFGDEIMVFGAPINNKRSEQTIALVKEQFPDKAISSVYVTLPYSDHIAGLPAYAAIGAKVYGDEYTVSAIKNYHKFSDIIETFEFQSIKHEDSIKGVRFFVLESSRSKRQSLAYFQHDKIIYQSDFLEVAFDNTVANIYPSYSKTFIDFIQNNGLKFKRIVGQHRNNNISPEIVYKIANANFM